MLSPLKSQVVVAQVPVEKVTESGILLTSDPDNNAEWVRIVSLGPDTCQGLTVASEVIIDWKYARQVKYSNQVYYIIPEAHIMLARG